MALDLTGTTGAVSPGSRILVWCDRADDAPRVAGLPLWRRAVYTACRAGFQRLVLVAPKPAKLRAEINGDSHLAGRRLDVVGKGEPWIDSIGAEGGRWVVTGEEWVVDAEVLSSLAETDGRTAVVDDGPFAASAEELALWTRGGWQPPAKPPTPVAERIAPPPVFVRVTDDATAAAAEDALFQGLARNVTNLFARYVDRPMSRAISRRLAPFPITPNQITIFSTLLGIVGSLVLLDPSYGAGVLGTFLFFSHTVIDGCDGEIARLKFQESAWGAKLDLIGDNVVHAFLFPCVALRLYFADPGGPYLLLGGAAFGGVIATWIVIYLLLVRSTPSPAINRVFEAFANREFAYLVFFLGLIGRLDWFVWAMAFGLWAFPIGLVTVWLSERRRS